MYWIALKMLVGDKAKYYGSIAGVTFAALLIAQQTSIFCGLMLRTTSQIQDIADADIWVMDPAIQYVDELKPIKEDCLQEVRGIPGVAWAVHFYKGQARMKKMDGRYQQCIVLGMDDASMVGAPQEILAGSLADLRRPDAVMMDEAGYHYLWPREPFQPGQDLRNERSSGDTGRHLQGVEDIFDIPHPLYALLPGLAVHAAGTPLDVVRAGQAGRPGPRPRTFVTRITAQTRLLALTRDEFGWRTMSYYLRRTSIPQNFAITIAARLHRRLCHRRANVLQLRAGEPQPVRLAQGHGRDERHHRRHGAAAGAVIGAIGYCLGVGLACLFGMVTQNTQMSFFMPWQVPVLTAASVALIVLLASLISVRRVLILEPAVVFQG